MKCSVILLALIGSLQAFTFQSYAATKVLKTILPSEKFQVPEGRVYVGLITDSGEYYYGHFWAANCVPALECEYNHLIVDKAGHRNLSIFKYDPNGDLGQWGVRLVPPFGYHGEPSYNPVDTEDQTVMFQVSRPWVVFTDLSHLEWNKTVGSWGLASESYPSNIDAQRRSAFERASNGLIFDFENGSFISLPPQLAPEVGLRNWGYEGILFSRDNQFVYLVYREVRPDPTWPLERIGKKLVLIKSTVPDMHIVRTSIIDYDTAVVRSGSHCNPDGCWYQICNGQKTELKFVNGENEIDYRNACGSANFIKVDPNTLSKIP